MKPHHVTVGGEPWCGWKGCQAGAALDAEIARVSGTAIACGHASRASAEAGAKLLRPHFRLGRVRVVDGPCPHFVDAPARVRGT